ncbi:hypothetical protein K469DRAFT_689929 [Zopfia rhizophila CBS 207.26]|uniref:Uncharacterized protein n=1 Tax=Zopfia rhizophila CBS 207.26 TaxID=1314779 RepID=A0A6A6DYK9_9PEZI|nr:hypothetical protein K469DRAFT_689929 [Zopfia rhizophila CBS 207.26]
MATPFPTSPLNLLLISKIFYKLTIPIWYFRSAFVFELAHNSVFSYFGKNIKEEHVARIRNIAIPTFAMRAVSAGPMVTPRGFGTIPLPNLTSITFDYVPHGTIDPHLEDQDIIWPFFASVLVSMNPLIEFLWIRNEKGRFMPISETERVHPPPNGHGLFALLSRHGEMLKVLRNCYESTCKEAEGSSWTSGGYGMDEGNLEGFKKGIEREGCV